MLDHTARSQEGGQRREAAGWPPPAREARTGTTGFEPAPSRLTSERSAPLSYAPKLRRWDSNPRSRAHEAREDGPSSTALSDWQESNLRSPVPETGGVASLPYSQMDTPGGT